MKLAVALGVVMSCALCFAEETRPSADVRGAKDRAIVAFRQSQEGRRLVQAVADAEAGRAMVPTGQERLDAGKVVLAAKKALADAEMNAVSADADVKQAEVEAKKAEKSTVKAQDENQSASLSQFLLKRASRPLESISVGQAGLLPSFRVIQVIDDKTLLVAPRGHDGNVMLRGVDTRGVADGDTRTYSKPVKISETTSYTTAIGTKATVYVAEPYEP